MGVYQLQMAEAIWRRGRYIPEASIDLQVDVINKLHRLKKLKNLKSGSKVHKFLLHNVKQTLTNNDNDISMNNNNIENDDDDFDIEDLTNWKISASQVNSLLKGEAQKETVKSTKKFVILQKFLNKMLRL